MEANQKEKVWGQKIIKCSVPSNKKNKQHSAAMKALNGNGYKLYSYLYAMAELDGGSTIFPWSSDDVEEYTGMGRHSFWIAVNELIDKGFVRLQSRQKRVYVFNGSKAEERATEARKGSG